MKEAGYMEGKMEKESKRQRLKGAGRCRMVLCILVILLTAGLFGMGGCLIVLERSGVYEKTLQEQEEEVCRRTLTDNMYIVCEAFQQYVNQNRLYLNRATILYYEGEIRASIDQAADTEFGKDVFDYDIYCFADTSQETELSDGDSGNDPETDRSGVICETEKTDFLSWTNFYSEKYLFAEYADAYVYSKQLLEANDSGKARIADQIITTSQYENKYAVDYPTAEDFIGDYTLTVYYEKDYKINLRICGRLTDAYRTAGYDSIGYHLREELEYLDSLYALRHAVPLAAVIVLAVWMLCFILLMKSSGYSSQGKENALRRYEKLPIEGLVVIIGGIILNFVCLFREIGRHTFQYGTNTEMIQLVACRMVALCGLVIMGVFYIDLLVGRRRNGGGKNFSMLAYGIHHFLGRESRISKWFRYLISKIPFIWKAVVIYIVYSVAEVMVLRWSIDVKNNFLQVYLIYKVCITILFLVVTAWLSELKNGGEKLVEGNTKYKINTRFMRGAFKKHGENLNNLNEGMQAAIEERMKSERMKTELITNVSHDIKTPLTSIINYVDLLQKQNITKEPEASYIEVLVRQSARLKKLIEDLVEASKASTGSIAVELKVMDANLVLAQATAEYMDRLKERELQLVIREADEPVWIMADGRHLWRVFDNLLNNAYKYAMPKTRVYINIEATDEQVQFIFKNISKDPLNISSEELMERFVRGDSSRNTEGNGLGLSIAKSLCQLMHAEFDIRIDGDLYKAVVAFARVEEVHIQTDASGADDPV